LPIRKLKFLLPGGSLKSGLVEQRMPLDLGLFGVRLKVGLLEVRLVLKMSLDLFEVRLMLKMSVDLFVLVLG